MDKSVVMIDGGYIGKLNKIEFSLQDGKPLRVDYGKIGLILASRHNSELLRTYYYNCPPFVSQKPTELEKEKQKKFDQFIFSLKKLDKFTPRFGKLKKVFNPDGTFDFEQKGVDVKLAIDALKIALKGKVNKIILIAGDSDFVPVIEAIKEESIEVILYYHESSIHRFLLEACDTKIPLNKELMNSFQ